jgi:hypothetical protein
MSLTRCQKKTGNAVSASSRPRLRNSITTLSSAKNFIKKHGKLLRKEILMNPNAS